MTAKQKAISAPAAMTIKAKGWNSLVKYQELTSITMAANGSAMMAHLNHTGRT